MSYGVKLIICVWVVNPLYAHFQFNIACIHSHSEFFGDFIGYWYFKVDFLESVAFLIGWRIIAIIIGRNWV